MTERSDTGPRDPAPGSPARVATAPEGAVVFVPSAGGGTPGRYAALRREHGSVAPVVLAGGVRAWLVLGYAEVAYVTGHDELFARDVLCPGPWPGADGGPWTGAAADRRVPSVARALEAVDQFELAQGCRGIAHRLVDAFAGSGRAELMTAYAGSLSLRAAVLMCGLPPGAEATEELVRDLGTALAGEEEPDFGTKAGGTAGGGGCSGVRGDKAVAAYVRAGERVRRLVAARRAVPGPDMVSRLLADPAGATDEEVTRQVLGMVAAAHRPTADWIGNTLRLLLTDERFARDVSGGRLSIGQALNEVLWLDTPTQLATGRRARRDTQLGGRRIRAGDRLVPALAAANTDPGIWPDGRAGAENTAHLSFGGGVHRCPYPAPLLADVIARTAIETLLERLPDTVLATEATEAPEAAGTAGAAKAAEPVWRPSVRARGLVTLPVRFTPVVR
ncbi:cytochrome P450 [Streptomyces qinzhouensis]|uniref:Cytochrome P450 n=1 Tax=Streptomyces qinzhouensis TaxID=2599401 RepID=A0A5B8JE22_9ACTN|nr:cytochrome P450 [Streptomyces qinzhouensis]QDY75723.1 cytochrome P450 [Streptomyces qinzhouensis]